MEEKTSPNDPMKVLFIDKEIDRVTSIKELFSPDYNFSELETTNRPRKAIQLLKEEDYDAIYIHDEFERPDLEAFFSDLQQIKGWNKPFCVQYRQQVKAGTNRKELSVLGFNTIISSKCDADDKSAIYDAMLVHFHMKEVEKKAFEVHQMIDFMLSEIDASAQDLKRGAKPNMNKIPNVLVELNTDFHTDVFQKYFEALIETAIHVQPPKEEALKVPEEILRKNLPELNEETYVGVSRRVWGKLLDIYGDSEENSEHPPTDDKPTPDAVEQEAELETKNSDPSQT